MTVRVRVLPTEATPVGLLGEVRRLLTAAFDGDFTDEDWAHTLGGRHVVALDGATPVSHGAVVARTIQVAGRSFRAGYVEAVATDPGHQREGLASLVMAEVTRLVRDEFELGVLSTGLPALYRPLGWERWQGPTFVRDGDRVIRTEDEDDGIMVLRFGPSEAVELTAAMSCERRPGDDW